MRAPSDGEPWRVSISTTSMRSRGRHVPDVGLADVQVKRLDARPGASSLKLTWRMVKPSSPSARPSVRRTSSVMLPPSSAWRASGTSATPSMAGAGPYACR